LGPVSIATEDWKLVRIAAGKSERALKFFFNHQREVRSREYSREYKVYSKNPELLDKLYPKIDIHANHDEMFVNACKLGSIENIKLLTGEGRTIDFSLRNYIGIRIASKEAFDDLDSNPFNKNQNKYDALLEFLIKTLVKEKTANKDESEERRNHRRSIYKLLNKAQKEFFNVYLERGL